MSYLEFFVLENLLKYPPGHSIGAYDENLIDLGLSMNPKFVGQGRGKAFCTVIISSIEDDNKNTHIRLTVAKFNKKSNSFI